MSRFPEGSLIAVTGANGFIGTWICRKLLEKGYRVRAVVRDPANAAKVAHLKGLAHSERLELAKGELNENDYNSAFVGVHAVVHTATPYVYSAPDPDKDIVQPAIAGTLAALRAAVTNKVQRVVVTSSGGAFLHFPVPEGYKFTVTDWNTMSTLTNNPYFLSKRKAEEAAWEFAKEHKEIEVVVVNPLYVLGPTISGEHLNQSLTNLKKLLMGEQGSLPLNGHIGIVDVRDVATAHVIAVSNPAAAGKRLFCCNKTIAWADIPAALKRLFPQYPNTAFPEVKPAPFTIDTQPLAELGLASYIDLDQMLKEGVEALIAQKIVTQV